ncbi:hypothetical protein IGI04_023384 [Brassica rapa subsp. trilocularis]|uniref:Uncharacterized protein n=1 Tax=Brassica rapa subsp. trilocularis TaxID=1813537 RepID=A0ABQ7M3N5_BRACM|nr:hypothetical protein IGI04_023384 [Brassica rapa subsp. trilocularis]
MIRLRYMGASIEEQTRMHGFESYPLIDVRDSSRPTKWLGWSLPSDRLVRGHVATWRPCLDPFLTFYECVLGLWVFSFDELSEFSARFHRKVFRKDFFTKITFRKNVHADFYGYLDVNFVVSVFDPNIYL